jgi:hypothetical protein
MRARFIVIDGPIAGGKSTVKYIIRKFIGGKALTITQSPYALITYAVAMVITRLVGNNGGTYPITYLEVRNPNLLGKLIKLFVVIDALQSVIIAVISKILIRLGVSVVVEDYVPAIMHDHIFYNTLYSNHRLSKDPIIRTLHEMTIASMNNLNPLIIYVDADVKTRFIRSIKRGFRIVSPETLYDTARRRLLIKVARMLINDDQVLIVDNNGPITNTKRQVIEILHKVYNE